MQPGCRASAGLHSAGEQVAVGLWVCEQGGAVVSGMERARASRPQPTTHDLPLGEEGVTDAHRGDCCTGGGPHESVCSERMKVRASGGSEGFFGSSRELFGVVTVGPLG